MEIILDQMLILGLIGLIGFIAFKSKALNSSHSEGLVKVIIKITLPLLIFTTFAGAKMSDEILTNFPYVFFASFLSVSILFLLSKISGKLLNLDNENTALHQVHSMFGNIVFLGFPLLDAIFPGGEGLIYASIFQLGHDMLMWTWGIFILNKAVKTKNSELQLKHKHNWKHLINPTTISFILGLLFLLFNIKIPTVIFTPLNGLGHTTIYISMIYIGLVLAQVKLKVLISNFRSYVLSLNKLIIAPIILLLAFYGLRQLGLDIPSKAIISSVMQAAMPCMVIISVLAQEMGLNAKQAVENIFVSSILSLLSLPFIFWLASFVFL
jgi:malate permease and related proteins